MSSYNIPALEISSSTCKARTDGNKSLLLPLILIAAAAVIIRLPNFLLPINRDSGLFAYGGWRILHGALPYADFFDNKLPGVFYLDALALRLFGVNNAALVIFQLIYSTLSAWTLYAVALKISSRKAALVAAVLFALYSGSYGLAEDGNYTECYIALPSLLAVLLVLKVPAKWGRILPSILAGALVAVAAIIKQPAASLLGALVIYSILVEKGRVRLISAAMMIAGAGVVAGLMAAWMAQKGILTEAIKANIVFNRLYFQDAYTYGLDTAKWNMLRGFILVALPTVGALAGVAVMLRQKKEMRWLLIPWLIFDLIGLAMGGRFYNHYYLAMLPSMLLTSSFCLDSLISSRRAMLAVVPIGLALIIGPVWRVESACPTYRGAPVSSIAEREYHALNWIFTKRIPQGKMLPFEAIAGWLKDNTDESDTIYVWGWETRTAFVSRRKLASRYLHMHPLGATGFDRDRRIRELARDIETRKPKYIVDTSPLMPTTAPPLGPTPAPPSTSPFFRLDGYEPVKNVVARLYQPCANIAGCTVYGLSNP